MFANTLAASGGPTTIELGTPGLNEQVGFFLIQDGFSHYGGQSGNLSFVSQGTRSEAHADGRAPIALVSSTLGDLDAVPIFHSFASLNPDRAVQVLSGVTPGGRDLQIGFEDLATATGDNDFQDVVINVLTSRDDVFFV